RERDGSGRPIKLRYERTGLHHGNRSPLADRHLAQVRLAERKRTRRRIERHVHELGPLHVILHLLDERLALRGNLVLRRLRALHAQRTDKDSDERSYDEGEYSAEY